MKKSSLRGRLLLWNAVLLLACLLVSAAAVHIGMASITPSQSSTRTVAALNHLDGVLLHLVPFGIILAGAGGYLISVFGLRPLSRLALSAQSIGAHNLSQRLPEQRDEELAELGGAFNQVLDRLEGSFESQKQFLADASHELRTPLSAIKVNTSVALSGAPSLEEYRTALECVDAAADKMGLLVNDLLFLSRSEDHHQPIQLVSVDVPKAAGAVLSLFKTAAAASAVDLENRVPEGLVVYGDVDLIERLLSNLVSNSLAHTPPGGHVWVEGSQMGETIQLRVRDTGSGISPEHLGKVFDRFYRVDPSRSQSSGGTGLGLSICRSIVESMYGTISIESDIGAGTTVTLDLPAA